MAFQLEQKKWRFFSNLSPTDVFDDAEAFSFSPSQYTGTRGIHLFSYSERGNAWNPLQIQTLTAALLHSWKRSEAIQTFPKTLSTCFCTQVSWRISYKGPESVREKVFSKIHCCLIHYLPMFKTSFNVSHIQNLYEEKKLFAIFNSA